MAQGQSAHKSHLPLLNALERVPVTNRSADFSQAWALGRGARPHSWNVPTPLTWDRLMACSLMQHKLPSPAPGSLMLTLMPVHSECTMAAASGLASWQSPDTPQQGQGCSSQEHKKQKLSSEEALDIRLNLCKYDQSTIKYVLRLGYAHTSLCIELNSCTDLHLVGQASASSCCTLWGPPFPAEPCCGQPVQPLCKTQKTNTSGLSLD